MKKVLLLLVIGNVIATPPAIAQSRPKISVAPPQVVFKPLAPVVWKTEPEIQPEEVALSQELGALVRQQQYTAALELMASSEIELSAAFELLRAQLESTLGNNARAIRAYESAIARAPNFTRAHAGLGTLLLIEGRTEKAHEHLARAVQLGASDAQTFAQLGYLNVKRGNAWGAVRAYEQALMLEPGNTSWKRALLIALTSSGNYASARALVESLLSADPNSTSLWQQRADLLLRMDQPEAALASLEAGLRLGDTNADNRRAAAQLAIQLGNARRGSEIASANVLAGSADMAYVAQLTEWMLRNGDEQYAENVLNAMRQKLQNYSPSQRSRYHFIKGRLAEGRGQQQQALADFRRAVEQDGSNGSALLSYAEKALELSQATRAQILFQRLSVLPNFRQQAMVGQAKAMIAQQDYAGALQQLQLTLDEFPDAYELNSAIQSLTAIVNTSKRIGEP